MLSRLDVSFTPMRKLRVLSDHQPHLAFEKLSLTSTPLTSSFLRTLDASEFSGIFTSLHTLQIGALGSSPLSSISTLTDSLTLTDEILHLLNDILVDCRALENISLVGNTKLGVQTGVNSALASFVRKVGRRCKVGRPNNCISTVTVISTESLVRHLTLQAFLGSDHQILWDSSLCVSKNTSTRQRRIP